jgi:hypothetical protein
LTLVDSHVEASTFVTLFITPHDSSILSKLMKDKLAGVADYGKDPELDRMSYSARIARSL